MIATNRLAFSLSLLAVAGFAACADARHVAGSYADVREPAILDLKKDGTLYLETGLGGLGLTGKYSVDGTEITITFSNGAALRGTIAGDTLRFPESTMVKKGVNELAPDVPSSAPQDGASSTNNALDARAAQVAQAIQDTLDEAYRDHPPQSLVQVDPCLMYKCGGDSIRVSMAMSLFDRPDASSRVTGTAAPGMAFLPDNMAVVTTVPGVLELTETGSIGQPPRQLRAGDRIYTYAHWGEGCFTVWAGGRLFGYSPPKEPSQFVSKGSGCVMLPNHTRTLTLPTSETWLRIPLSEGKKVWLRVDAASVSWGA